MFEHSWGPHKIEAAQEDVAHVNEHKSGLLSESASCFTY